MFQFSRFPFKESNSVTCAAGFLPGLKSSFFFFFCNSTSSLTQDAASANKPGFAWAACCTFSVEWLANTPLHQDHPQSKQCNKRRILKTTGQWQKIQTSKKEIQNKFCTAGLSHVLPVVLHDSFFPGHLYCRGLYLCFMLLIKKIIVTVTNVSGHLNIQYSYTAICTLQYQLNFFFFFWLKGAKGIKQRLEEQVTFPKTGKTVDTLVFLYIQMCPKGSSKKPHFKTFGLIPILHLPFC